MPSAAVISHALVSSHQQQEISTVRKMAMAAAAAGSAGGGLIEGTTTEHLSRVAARARTAGTGTGRGGTVRRAQSAKSGGKRSMSRRRTSGSSADGQRKKKGLLEFGPLRFIAPKNEGKRLRPSSLQRQDTMHSQKPGLRAMLYGLTLKMEREEKLQKKLQRKMAASTAGPFHR